MPLILDYEPTAALYRRCGEARLTMARIGYSDQHHLLGIVEGAARFAREHAITELPLGIFSTVGHYILQMLPRYLHADHVLPAAGGDPAAYRRRLHRNVRLATGFLATLPSADDTDPADVAQWVIRLTEASGVMGDVVRLGASHLGKALP